MLPAQVILVSIPGWRRMPAQIEPGRFLYRCSRGTLQYTRSAGPRASLDGNQHRSCRNNNKIYSLGAGNDGASQRRSEQVSVLEDGIALDGSVAQLLDKLALQVLDDELDGAHGEGFLLGGSKVFDLADVGLIKGLRSAYRTYRRGG